MRYTSRIAVSRSARSIASSALDANAGHSRLKRCRALLRVLDPERPPTSDQAREFRWQYRALRERVHLYSERLEALEDSSHCHEHDLHKAETAIELSLEYFKNALSPDRGLDDDDES